MAKMGSVAWRRFLACVLATAYCKGAADRYRTALHDEIPGGKAGELNCKRLDIRNYPSPKQVNQNCYTEKGHAFRGRQNVAIGGKACVSWRTQKEYSKERSDDQKYGIGDHNYCRNPDQEYNIEGTWCYVAKGIFGRCDVPACQQYVYDPLNHELTPTCDRHRIEIIYPDFMYAFRGDVYYATRGKRTYEIFEFGNTSMTSLSDVKPSDQAWNFCHQRDDTATFASSYDQEYLFIYFEKPDAMIKLSLGPNPDWDQVDKRIYTNCTSAAKPQFVLDSYTAIKQVFSLNEPNVVLLLSNGNIIRCEWADGFLKFINSTKSPFGTCPSGKLHFIDRDNKLFQLYDPSRSTPTPRTRNVVRSSVIAVNEYPAFAFALMGYDRLNNKSLVTLHDQSSDDHARDPCEIDGKRSRIFRLYEGRDMEDAMDWIKLTADRRAWLLIHDIKIRRSSFCNAVSNVSCCKEIVDQVLADGVESANDHRFFVSCELSFQSKSAACPRVSCLGSAKEGERVMCEIHMGDDSPPSVSPEEILDLDEEEIFYEDINQAVATMDAIAAGIKYQNQSDTRTLSILVDSLEALQNLDYKPLSRSGAGDLISDVVHVADSIVDDGRADVWSSLREEGEIDENKDPHGGSAEMPSPESGKREKNKKLKSPADILFTLESVLAGIVSGQVFNNSTDKNPTDFVMKFETKNIISSIQRTDHHLDTLSETDGSFVKFDLPANSSDAQQFAVVSRYPKLMQLISRVDRHRSGRAMLHENGEDEKNGGRNLEYIKRSPVISAFVMQQGKKLSSGITFAIPFEDEDIPQANERDSKMYFSCRYLSGKKHPSDDDNWDETGCRVAKVDHKRKLVHCSCNHTTNFAILLQVVPPKIRKIDFLNLQIISYVGEAISVFCLFLTLVTFILLRRSLQSARMVAHFHLVIALILFHATQLTAGFAEKTKNQQSAPCVAVAAMTHFSLLATFCWMLVEGILLYMSVVSVFHSMKIMNVLKYVVGWVLPGIICGITAVYGLTRHPYPTCYLEGVGTGSCALSESSPDAQPYVQIIEWCWLSSSNSLVLAMVVPAIVALMVNTVILARVACVIAKTSKSRNMYRPTTERKKEQHTRKCLKGAMILMPILGVPWMFGLVPQAASHVGMLYVFTILNSIQGVFIFLFYCVLSSEVRSAFGRYIRKKNILHSQNWTSSHASGKPIDNRFEKHRPETKSDPSPATDLLTNDQRTRSSRSASSCEETRRDQDVMLTECGDNSSQKSDPHLFHNSLMQ